MGNLFKKTAANCKEHCLVNKRELVMNTPEWSLPLLPHARYKGAKGGRGSGKSHFMAERMIEEMINKPNTHCVCIREVQSSIKMSVKRLLEMKIESLGVQDYFEVQEAIIKSKKGSGVIIFQGMQNHTADSIKSLESFDICWCEEAHSLTQRSLDLLRPTMRKDGCEMWFSWNPNLPTDPIDAFFMAEDPFPGAIFVEVNFDKNPWFPKDLQNEAEYDRVHNPEKYAHVWEGKYAMNAEARVFKNWRIEDFVTPPGMDFRFGADWGFATDPTVLIRMFTVGRKLYIDYEAYKVRCGISETPALFLSVPESEKWPIIADSARPELIDYMRKKGFKIWPAVKGNNSIVDGIEFLQDFEIIVHTRCKNVASELTTFCYLIDKMTNLVTSKLPSKKNHTIDGIRYAQEGERRVVRAAKRTIDFKPLPVRSEWSNYASRAI